MQESETVQSTVASLCDYADDESGLENLLARVQRTEEALHRLQNQVDELRGPRRSSKRLRDDEKYDLDQFLRDWRQRYRCGYYLTDRGCRRTRSRCGRIHCDATSAAVGRSAQNVIDGKEDTFFRDLVTRFRDARCGSTCSRVLASLEKLKKAK